MSDGHVEIHDPFSNHKDHERSTDDDTDNMEDTVEFRLLMAYATRRRAKSLTGRADQNGTAAPRTPPSPPPPAKTESEEDKKKKKKMKKKKRGWKRLSGFLRCIKPQTRGDEPEQNAAPEPDNVFRCGGLTEDEVKEDDELEDAASQLAQIADEIPFIPPELETDSADDDVERMIGLLLRESGDRLNERELRDVSLAKELFWNYGFFKRIVSTLLSRMGLTTSDPGSPGPHASPKAQIAVACEATSRLSAMDTLPTSRLLGYGARYLREYYSSWAQEQGGYEAAFESDDDDVQ